MSLSGSSNEMRRAVMSKVATAGGTTADAESISADEDRELVAIEFGKNADNGFIEASFSSTANLQDGSQDNARASTIAIFGGSASDVQDLNLDWGEGEEIHVHTKNNTGSTYRYTLVFYYRELE